MPFIFDDVWILIFIWQYAIILIITSTKGEIMLLEYIVHNYMTLTVLFFLAAVIFTNKNAKIPASALYSIAIVLLLIITVCDFAEKTAYNALISDTAENVALFRGIRLTSAIIEYILRPVIILLEILLLLPEIKYKLLCTVPSVINAVVYLIAPIKPLLVFGYDRNNHFFRGRMGYSVFFTMFFYLMLLVCLSLKYFKKHDSRKNAILAAIIISALVTAQLELSNRLVDQANTVTALSLLLYYFYLAIIYQQDISESLAEKELRIIKDNMIILRNQIQPHFIFNSLSIIRSLTKKDKVKAVESIDRFSDYLRSHINALQSDELITFEKEMENVNAFLALVQTDYTKKIEVRYDIHTTEFYIPPLSLEPIVENAVKHGTGADGGTVTITTCRENNNTVIRIKDSGNYGQSREEEHQKHTGIGLENTRKRLEFQCNGSLEMKKTGNGTVVEIIIPDKGDTAQNLC